MTLQKYINSIRNTDKKAYAQTFSKWVLDGEQGKMPQTKSLGAMAAQAVRLNVYQIVRGK